jgi:asparagine synthase (glutamine-hydrolysing)
MCGIFGVAALRGDLTGEQLTIVARGSGAHKHRGPDGDGSWNDQRVALAHRRLAIIDLSDSGHQPMQSDSGRYVITYNGEIYNHQRVAARLTSSGWMPRGSSDTEVLLAALERWGLDATLETIDGMYAFGLYDRKLRRLILARDRFGEKPLHYSEEHGRLWFGSEVRSLEFVPGIDRRLSMEATRAYFRSGYVPGDRTIFSTMRRVSPGVYVEWNLDTGASRTKRYWAPNPGPDVDEDALLDLMAQSVASRMVSDRPVGAFLSGGVDSSLVCALAAKASSEPLRTFTMAWDDREYDESTHAAAVASALGTRHTEIRLGRSDIVSASADLGNVLDEPFADSSLLATHLVARETRRHVVVALSGDGGDELFGGYNRHRWLLRVAALQRRPRALRSAVSTLLGAFTGTVETVTRPIAPHRRPRLVADKMSKLARSLTTDDLLQAYQSTLAIDPSIGRPHPLSPEVNQELSTPDPNRSLLGLRLADLGSYLPDDVLTKVDRSTMACALESRAPFLNPEVAAAALAMKPERLFDSRGGKAPLRRLLRRLIPDVSFDRSKMGFGVPVASLLRGELREMLGDAVTSFERRPCPITLDSAGAMTRLVDGDDAPQHRLWAILAFELWAERRSIEWSEDDS